MTVSELDATTHDRVVKVYVVRDKCVPLFHKNNRPKLSSTVDTGPFQVLSIAIIRRLDGVG